MKTVVCIKQVPDSTNVRINPRTNTLMREGVESVLNPFDEFALEQALRLKDSQGAQVIVISMGPPQAKAVLREALARGADEAVLVSSRAFGGADTLATSYTLAKAIRAVCGSELPDLVLLGKQAIDGDTAQVGPGVSEFLGFPLVTYVKELTVGPLSGSGVRTYRAVLTMDDGDHVVEGALPAVMTVTKDGAMPRFASLAGAVRARAFELKVLDEKAIEAEAWQIGLTGSPTKVVRIFPPPVKQGGDRMPWTGDAHGLAERIREAIHD